MKRSNHMLKVSKVAGAMIAGYGLTLGSNIAFAQQNSEGSRLSTLLEEVVVTARKREESLQDTPISITAMTGDSLEVRGITNISEVGNITPNLNYVNNPQAGGSSSVATVYIRGVGQRDFLGTIDNGVGFYIDDVYIARTVGATVELLDVDRIEVLRGPQGTLFGRNNVGGAMKLHSKKPTEDAGGYVSATIGTDSLYKLKGTFNAPVSDKFLTSFSALVSEQDGYVDRPAGGDLGDDDTKSARGSFLWQAADNLEVSFSADYSKEEENGPAFVLADTGTLSGPGVFADFYNNVTAGASCAYPGGLSSSNPLCYNNQNYVSEDQNLGTAPTFSDTEVWGTKLTVEWDISDNLKLKSITAYRELDAQFARDSDASPTTVVHFFDDFVSEQFSQELQLSGSAFGGNLDWITGLYYFDEEGTNQNLLEFAIANFISGSAFTTESKAAFAQGTYHINDKLDLTAGIRYTEEDKTYDPVQTVGPNNIGLPIGLPIVPFGLNERTTDETTPMLNLAYDINDNLMAYATYSEGFRSGGFVQRIFPPLPFVPDFGPEFVDSYELGFKYDTDAFSLNGAVFKMDYTDIQVRTQNPGFIGFFEANVGDAEVSGLELELKWQPADTWFVEASYGYTDAEYTEIRVDPPLVAQVNLNSEFDFVPEHAVSISLSKEIDLGTNGSLVARLSGNYRSEYFTNPDNTEIGRSPSIDLWNTSLVWTSPSEAYSVNLGVKNLTDEEYLLTAYHNIAIGLAEHLNDRGRQWYLSARYNF